MPSQQTYTIAEAAALTGLHRNTIRQKIRLGQLEAAIHPGKFGEEYRIPHGALVKSGILDSAEPERDEREVFSDPDSEFEAASPQSGEEASLIALASLSELFQRHEQVLFRLGYLQSELERTRALAETAESLREDGAVREREMEELRSRLQDEARRAEEAVELRAELHQARTRLQEMERLRGDLEELKRLAVRQEEDIGALRHAAERSPWWQFWKR